MKKDPSNIGLRALGGITLAAALAWVAPAQAAEAFLSLGLDVGGDEMVKVYYDHGGNDEINAGELVQFSGGVIIPTFSKDSDWETQLSFGWKFDSISARNGDASFDRYPLEALQFIRMDNLRIGGGITLHMNPELEGDGVLSGLDVQFDDAWGGIVELDYLAGDILMIGVRATMIDYEARNVTVDGSSVGLTMGMRFR